MLPAQARGAPPDALHEISVPDLVSGPDAGAWCDLQRFDRELHAVQARGRRTRLVAPCSSASNGAGARRIVGTRSYVHKFFKVVGAA